MSKLKRCPCGAVPKWLRVETEPPAKFSHVYGECCGEWIIEFRSQYTKGEELLKRASDAWNEAPRAEGK